MAGSKLTADKITATSVTTTGALELGDASDTTISRVSAGVIAIEGDNIVTASSVPGPLPDFSGNSLKVVRINAGETAYEAATGGGGGGLDEAEIYGRMCAAGVF